MGTNQQLRLLWHLFSVIAVKQWCRISSYLRLNLPCMQWPTYGYYVTHSFNPSLIELKFGFLTNLVRHASPTVHSMECLGIFSNLSQHSGPEVMPSKEEEV